VILHVNSAGIAYAASRALPLDAAVPSTPSVTSAAARARVAGASGDPALVYVVATSDRTLHLAWQIEARGPGFVDRVFVDAQSGDIVDRLGLLQPVLSRAVYDAGHTTALPGVLARSEGGAAHADVSVNDAYANAGMTYDCYQTLFGRDGIDGAGSPIVASVHYGNAVANAFWNGSQMAFGDGDGTTFSNLAHGYDVVAHELTHGVTQHTAGLAYANEPGALNEAFSDIMAARCEAFRLHDDVSPAVWLLGEDVFTPGTPGDALRYLADPAADGGSSDFYPTRYTGAGDYGGVHTNSGIANLAFALLAKGGSHPRGKTTNNVPALGIDRAGRIFYRALTTYLTPSAGFEAARIATAQAAVDLYGPNEVLAVEAAWSAVGVEEGMTAVTTLQNKVPVTNLANDSGATRTFALAVPATAASVTFSIEGGSGNADLYVRFGAPPTSTIFDYAPRTPGNAETVTAAAKGGTWYVRVRTLSGYSGVTLRAAYEQAPVGTQLQNGVPVTISGAAGSQRVFYVTFPAKATNMVIRTSGGTGDADLYMKYGAGNVPTITSYDHSSAWGGNLESLYVLAGDPESGTWQVMVRGQASYANVALVASWTPDPGTATLVPGVPTAPLSGGTGSRRMFRIDAPDGATLLKFDVAAPTEYPWDSPVDIFVKKGAEPTLTSYDGHASVQYSKANYTPINVALPGPWFVMVRGKSTYSNVTLTASYVIPPPPQPLGNGASVGPLSGTSGTEQRFTIDVPPGATNLSITTTGGTGDSDLYVKLGAPPTTVSYDRKSATYGSAETIALPTVAAGRYHVLVRGYTLFSGVTLRASFTPPLQN
jgi:vibriolysin